MKSISTYVQLAALAACLAAQFHPASGSGMPGTRKALQTLETFAAPAAQVDAWKSASGREPVDAGGETGIRLAFN